MTKEKSIYILYIGYIFAIISLIYYSIKQGEIMLAIIVTLTTSLLAGAIAIIFGMSQRKHNRNSVKPIGNLVAENYPNLIGISLHNFGAGTLIIKDIIYIKDDEIVDGLSKIMPPVFDGIMMLPSGLINTAVPVGREMSLLRITPTKNNLELDKALREDILTRLNELNIAIKYVDIYETEYTTAMKITYDPKESLDRRFRTNAEIYQKKWYERNKTNLSDIKGKIKFADDYDYKKE